MLHGINCKCRDNFFYISVSNIQCYTVLTVNVDRISSTYVSNIQCYTVLIVNVDRISSTYLFQTYKATRC